jgi:phosphoheptose isomerase
MTARAAARQIDVTRAIKAARSQGLHVVALEIEGGRVIVRTSDQPPVPAPAPRPRPVL